MGIMDALQAANPNPAVVFHEMILSAEDNPMVEEETLASRLLVTMLRRSMNGGLAIHDTGAAEV